MAVCQSSNGPVSKTEVVLKGARGCDTLNCRHGVMTGMQIALTKTSPTIEGYYLVRFSPEATIHLVRIKIDTAGCRSIIAENGKPLYFNEFPNMAYWSALIECNL